MQDAAAAGVSVIRFIGMAHAKIFIVDDGLARVVDPRSLLLNFEANAIVCGAEEVGVIAAWIKILRDSTQKGAPPVSDLRDTIEGVARILDPLL